MQKVFVATTLLLTGIAAGAWAQSPQQPAIPKFKGAWTDVKDKTMPEDFYLQGEFTGTFGAGKAGAQIISLGKDSFQAVLLVGGLPGDGWDGTNKILMDGKRQGATATFKPSTGKRRYNAPKADEFAATAKFPPPGQKDCTGTLTAGVFKGTTADGIAFEFKKVVRTSPTQGLRPPPGALVLFGGSLSDTIKGGRVDNDLHILHTDGKDISTKLKFLNIAVHIEFMTCYKPEARAQVRGNSGVYLLNQYEVQILDSFGLDGKKNECGSLYEHTPPSLNMCLPPLQWQTFDIDFTAATVDEQGKKTKNARATVKHNGVLVHDSTELTGRTGLNSRRDPEGTPGVVLLQGHGNPTQFANVWLLEKK